MQKKLRKSADRKLFGVRGGIGEYLDIDPTVIRLGFIVAFFGLGTGLLLYVIMAVVMRD
jgi:phage shock protein C